MTINGYTSRNIPSPTVYAEMLERRMKAKKAGDKATANALKLIANTTYGATLNQYNALYDPLQARSVCISGQLYLIELSNHLAQAIPGLKIVQTNTDGIMVEFDSEYYDQVLEITKEWQERTGFELEEDEVARIYQRDVNNYCEVAKDGSVKLKGGALVRGMSTAGAFKVNNNANIIATAIVEYFVHGTPVADTINACTDIFQFQMIAKAGAKYREMVDEERRPVQKVNRVYAVKDPRYGKLFKVKAETGGEAKIESLPEHCYIDNSAVDDPNHLSVDKVDRQWYIDVATKRIDDFKGIKPEKKTRRRTMATTKTPNVFEKLNLARKKFLETNVEKSGTHNKLMYHFFELEDIVPAAISIFNELGLFAQESFSADQASMTVYNTDNPSEAAPVFTIPFRVIEPILSKSGDKVINEAQCMGASVTYYRRYLWQIVLDITEHDEMDSGTLYPASSTQAPTLPQPEPSGPPATPAERAEIRLSLTNADGAADEVQINQLKASLRELKAKVPEAEEWIGSVALETKGFKVVSKTRCAEILAEVAQRLEA